MLTSDRRMLERAEMLGTNQCRIRCVYQGDPATTRRKSWRRFRARGSSGSAPRLEWAQPAPRWSPVEEAPAAPAEVQAVESPEAGTPVAATTAVAIQVAVAPTAVQRNRPAAKPRRA